MHTAKRDWRLVSLPITLVVVAAFLLTGCAAPPAAPPPPAPAQPQTIGTPAPTPKPAARTEKADLGITTRGANETHFFVGLAKGFFKEEAIDLRMQIMKTDVAVAAIIAGEIEFTSAAGTPLQAAARGAPIRTVLSVQGKPPWHVMVRPEIRSVQDLKGKKIGVGTARTAPQFVMMKILQKNGLDPNKDAVFLGLGGVTTTRLGALRAGAVDALLESAPAHLVLKKEGFIDLMKTSSVVPEWPTSSLTTGLKKIKDAPDMVKRTIRATLKGMMFAKENKTETVDILMKELAAELNLDRESMTGAYEDAVDGYTKDGTMSDEGLVNQFAVLRDFGEKVDIPQAANLVDYSILQEVQKELKLR
ncbi:MAG: ABC transporter substrate-binding protein [Chloroflexi bacterium]|nr:ABC transporter substrate-binding protein [Chloroflexota bacterium]